MNFLRSLLYFILLQPWWRVFVEIGQIELPIGRQYSAAVKTFVSKKSNTHPVQAHF
jgi:hypothetical protein